MFEVAPWEVESDKARFESFGTIEWQGETWEFASPDAGSHKQFFFRRQSGQLLYLPSIFQATRVGDKWEVSAELIRKTLAGYMANGGWTRILHFDKSGQLRAKGKAARLVLTLSPLGEGRWRDSHDEDSSFFWSGSGDFLLCASAQEVLERLQTEPTKSRSDYARVFMDFDGSKRWNELWGWRNGDRETFQRLVLGALIVQREADVSSGNAALYLDFQHSNDEARHIRLACDNEWKPITPALRAAVRAAIEHCGPYIRTEQTGEHLCLREALERYPWILKVSTQSLTAHERLEAAMRWREWLAQTGKP